jgi:hypothetical protein
MPCMYLCSYVERTVYVSIKHVYVLTGVYVYIWIKHEKLSCVINESVGL